MFLRYRHLEGVARQRPVAAAPELPCMLLDALGWYQMPLRVLVWCDSPTTRFHAHLQSSRPSCILSPVLSLFR